MTLSELVTLIHRCRTGAAVTITSINIPDHSRGGLYGILTVDSRSGGRTFERTFHSEEELRKLLEIEAA